MRLNRKTIILAVVLILGAGKPDCQPTRLTARRVKVVKGIKSQLEILYHPKAEVQESLEWFRMFFIDKEGIEVSTELLESAVILRDRIQSYRTQKDKIWYEIYVDYRMPGISDFPQRFIIICDKAGKPLSVAIDYSSRYFMQLPDNLAEIVINKFLDISLFTSSYQSRQLWRPWAYYGVEGNVRFENFLERHKLFLYAFNNPMLKESVLDKLTVTSDIPIWRTEDSANLSFLVNNIMWRDIENVNSSNLNLFSRYFACHFMESISINSRSPLYGEFRPLVIGLLDKWHPEFKIPIRPDQINYEEVGMYLGYLWEKFVSKYTNQPLDLPPDVKDKIKLLRIDLELFYLVGFIAKDWILKWRPGTFDPDEVLWEELPEEYFIELRKVVDG